MNKRQRLKRFKNEIECLNGVINDRNSDIGFYWGMFHQIENVRLNPDTTDDEKWEKIGELTSSILKPNEFD
jgi:hypothetical protein